MNRIVFFLVIFTAFFLLQSCVASKKTVMRSDPLIGKIIDSNKKTSVSYESMVKDINNYDVIYLSEKHDNPDHHTAQEKIIQSLIEMGLNPTIGFEFFSMDHTPHLLNFIDSGKVSHSKKNEKFIENDLRKKLGWDTQSDKMWSYYFSLLNLAKKHNLSAAGIDMNTGLKRRLTRKGFKGITPLEKEQIFSTHLDNGSYKEYMHELFKAVHCGMGHERMQERLYDTWTARNDKMAFSISQVVKHNKAPVIVIIGGGHTEYGLGVIDRVKAINPDITQVNIGFQEISRQPSTLTDYLEPLDLEGFEPSLPHNYLWFTQRVSYADPCEEFKSSLKKMNQHK